MIAAPDPGAICVIGASGFIGRHLLALLSERGYADVRVLVRRERAESSPGVQFIEGDLLNEDSLEAFLAKGCTVINLAYLDGKNLEAAQNLARACEKKQVRRVIHCSTAVVAGRTDSRVITERSVPRPIGEYQATKLQMEEVLLRTGGDVEVSILRPTAVLGAGGKNLLKLANELTTGSPVISYLRSCLFNRRSMNLVCVENVVAALVFLIEAAEVDREIFIIADDDSPINNYRDVESRLMKNFGKSYGVPQLPVPAFLLTGLLKMFRKSHVRTSLTYSDEKLRAKGFRKTRELGSAIDAYSQWYKNSHSTQA